MMRGLGACSVVPNKLASTVVGAASQGGLVALELSVPGCMMKKFLPPWGQAGG